MGGAPRSPKIYVSVFKKILGAFFCLLLIPGCQEDRRPAMSLDEARRVQASIEGQASFVPPPRSTADIMQLLEQAKPDPARVLALRNTAQAEFPGGANPTAISESLIRRGQARFELGMLDEAISDYIEADRNAQDNKLDTGLQARALLELGTAYFSIGDLRNAVNINLHRIDLAKRATPVRHGLISAGHAAVASGLSGMGDLAGADAQILSARRMLLDSDWRKWPGFQQFIRHQENLISAPEIDRDLASGQLQDAERKSRRVINNADWSLSNLTTLKVYSPLVADSEFYSMKITGHRLLGFALLRQGRLAEAEVEARTALKIALSRFGLDSLATARAAFNLGDVMFEQGRFAEARFLVQSGLEVFDRYGISKKSRTVAQGLASLANTHLLSGDPITANGIFERAADIFSDDPELRFQIAEGRTDVLVARIAAGRQEAAVDTAKRLAEKRAGSLGPRHYLTAEARGVLAAAHAALGQRDQALSEFRSAVPILLQVSRQSEDEQGRARRDYILRFILESYVDLLATIPSGSDIGFDPASEAFRVADAARARGVQRALAESAARTSIRNPDLASLVRQEQDARKQIGALFGLLSNVMARPASQQDPTATASLRTKIDTLREARAALREEIERRFPDYANLIDPRPATVGDVQGHLRRGEALLSIYVGARKSFVWAVPKIGPVAFSVVAVGDDEAGKIVTQLRRALDPNAATLGEIPAFDVALAHKLYQQFVSPVRKALEGSDSLLIVPDKALGQVPFSLLVTSPTAAPAEVQGRPLFSGYTKVPFLAREMAVTQLPSVASLGTLRRLPPPDTARKPFIGFGDPYFSADQASSGAAQVAQLTTRGLQTRGLPLLRRSAPQTQSTASAELASLPRLPDTADEVRSIAMALKADPVADVFLGLQASESQVKAAGLSDRKVVMFATHGLVPGDLNGLTQPALALTSPAVASNEGDGLLTMDEVLGLRLDADWVVLSACNTATGDGAGAEAISGLGRAFFYAGTRALLVSNWPVETTSARVLTTDLFARQAADSGLARAKAMQQAMLALIDGPGFVEGGRTVFSYAHPIFWAPFSVVGDGGAVSPGG
jgi:CHAT domain-containing protein